MNSSSTGAQRLTILVPVYNEAEVLPQFLDRLHSALVGLKSNYVILFVDDGSTDGSADIIQEMRRHHGHVCLLRLSRNFGKEIAMTAGLDHAEGDAVVVIDADLQDPPELIVQMEQRWLAGFDVVYARRSSRQGESALRAFSARAYYRLLNRLSEIPIPNDTGDFRLLSARAAAAVAKCRERHRYMKGLFAWVGFSQTEIVFDRAPRAAGQSKWKWRSLMQLAFSGIASFSAVPLRLATWMGFVIAFGCAVYASWFFAKTLIFGDPVQGFPTLIVVVLLLGGAQLIALGVIGEYIGQMFDELKNRPLYLVDRYYSARGVGEST